MIRWGGFIEQVIEAKSADPGLSRTAKLMRAGRSKMAKKLAEEAIEVVIDAMNGDREAVVRESADLLYNLVVLWAEAGVRPQDVFAEMARRERLFGLAEKLPKKHVETSAPPQGGPARRPPQKPAALRPRHPPHPPRVDNPALAPLSNRPHAPPPL